MSVSLLRAVLFIWGLRHQTDGSYLGFCGLAESLTDGCPSRVVDQRKKKKKKKRSEGGKAPAHPHSQQFTALSEVEHRPRGRKKTIKGAALPRHPSAANSPSRLIKMNNQEGALAPSAAHQ